METPILFYFRNEIDKKFLMITLRSYMRYFNGPKGKTNFAMYSSVMT